MLTDREALEHLRETHPELRPLRAIADLPEETFVTRYATTAFQGDQRLARRVHKTAVQVQQQAALLWANLKDAASPWLAGTLFNNIPATFLEHQATIPGYDRLFGNLNVIDCDDRRSIFSPAAYFVDLMRFIEQQITNGNAILNECQLAARRPDLFRLRLDRTNTDELIPYIDLVNEVLATLVATAAQPDADQVAAAARFPMTLPFHRPLAELRYYLQTVGLTLPDLYRTLAPDPTAPVAQGAQVRASLALSPNAYELITTERLQPAALSTLYATDVTQQGSNSLIHVDTFLRQTGLDRQTLNDLVYQDLDRHEFNAGLARLFFINNVDDGLGPLIIEQGAGDPENPHRPPPETLRNLSPRKLDHIHRFLRLSRQLEWSFSDTDWALRALQPPFVPERLLHFDGINDYVACRQVTNLDLVTFTLEAWVNPARTGRNVILRKGNAADPRTHFMLWIDAAGQLAFHDAPTSPAPTTPVDYVHSVRTLPTRLFSHVAAVVTPTSVALYIDGQLDRTAPRQAPVIPVGSDLEIGRDLNGEVFVGLIKEVRIWREARSQSALAANRYRRLTGRESNLAGYWPLIENRWNILFDHTPNRNDGLLGGAEVRTTPRWVSENLVLDPLPEGVARRGYHFNGVDQFLAARAVQGLESNRLTLEAWIKLDTAGDNVILCKGNPATRRTQFLFWVNAAGRLAFRSTSLGEYTSSGRVNLHELTHVAVAVSDGAVQFYFNGSLDSEQPLATPPTLDPQGDELQIGLNFSGRYFSGLIKEVRIWDRPRNADELALHLHRTVAARTPGLIGYWRLDGSVTGLAQDLSYNGNDLYLGGIPADYQPDAVAAPFLLPDPPIATTATVLTFDGVDDFVTIRNSANHGLGRYERFTLELWFNATDPTPADQPQVLYHQGDGEGGLVIYLLAGRLYLTAWCSDYEQSSVQTAVLTTDAVTAGQWHHLTVTYDETLALDVVALQAYLDGTAFADTPTQIDVAATDFRLSPVGPTYLGGVATDAEVRFHDGLPLGAALYPFRGQLADLRLWRRAKTAQEIGDLVYRHVALREATDDLLAYLPMNDGVESAITTISADQRVILDQTGNNQDATLQIGADDPVTKWVVVDPGPFAEVTTALALDADDYVELPDVINSDVGAIELWVKFASLADQRLFDASTDNTTPRPNREKSFFIEIENERLRVRLEDVNDRDFDDAEYRLDRNKVDLNVWHHIAVVWRFNGRPVIQLFFDGQLVETDNGNAGGRPLFNNPFLGLARSNYRRNDPFTGQISEVRIWARARTADEIQADRTRRLQGDEAGLTHYWIFADNPKVTTLTDPFRDTVQGRLGDGERQREPDWMTSEQFPVLLQPLSPTALHFDGAREYLAAENISGLDLTAFTLEAWVNPTRHQVNPIVSWGSAPGATAAQITWFGLDAAGHLTLVGSDSGAAQATATDTTTLALDTFTHVLLTVTADEAIFTVDGVETSRTPLSAPVPLQANHLEIGREFAAASFAGQLREVRIWDGTRTPDAIAADRYQRPATDTPGLVGDWPFRKVVGVTTEDQTANANHLRLGGLERARRPVLVDPTTRLTTLPPLPPDYALSFDGVDDRIRLNGPIDNGAEPQRTRTVELWFQAQEPWRSDRKQVLYTESQPTAPPVAGINLYLFDGKLYAGHWFTATGDAPDAEAPTIISTFLESDAIVAGIWHHVALVLDGGDALVANGWRAYLDGAPVGEGEALQLAARSEGVTLGAATPATRFHDSAEATGEETATGHAFAGQLGEVRLWRTARTQAELLNHLHAAPDPAASPDLLCLWRVDEGEGNLLHDATANGLNGLLGGAPNATAQQPTWRNLVTDRGLFDPVALKFDGQDDFLTLPALALGTQPYLTWEAWVRPDRLSGLSPLWEQNDGAFQVAWDGNQLQVTVVGNAPAVQRFDYGFDQTEWAHVALVYSSPHQVIQLFVDGALVATQAYTTANPLTITAAYMGETGMSDAHYQGLLKEVRLWTQPRSVEAINAYRFRRLAGDEPFLHGYWPLNEEGETVALDRSRHVAHAQLQAATPTQSPVWLSPDCLATELGYGFWRPDRTVLGFQTPEDAIHLPAPAESAAGVRKRRTIELWFKVDDKAIAGRKQVLYHEGDGKRGLVIYLYDGALYGGGYNTPADESGWQGAWLQTEQVERARWHHVALVLDGRRDVRAGALRLLLDGKVIMTGAGSQLWAHQERFTLGGARGSVRFHDGPVTDGAAHWFAGQVLDLRIWNTARLPEAIRTGRYRQLVVFNAHLPGEVRSVQDLHLTLWWQFENITENRIPDLSGHGRDGTINHAGQLQTLGELPVYTIPATPLDERALTGIAQIQELREQHRLSLERLAALWFGLRAVGRADGRTLFDQIFNPPGATVEPWRYYRADPPRWDVTGRRNPQQDREIRSRLMGALQVSHENLNLIVARLSGSATPVTLDQRYLTQLYQLAQLPKILRLPVNGFFRLLDLLDLPTVRTLADVRLLSGWAAWMRRVGISVEEIDFFANDTPSARFALPVADAALRDLAAEWRRQASAFLVRPESFVTTEVNQFQSNAIVQFLRTRGLIDASGAVTAQYRSSADLTALPGFANRADIQTQVGELLARYRGEHANAVLAGLATLLEAEPRILQLLIDHFRAEMSPVTFFQELTAIGESQPIPERITDYLYRLNKLLYLVNRFMLTPVETAALLAHPEHFSVSDVLRPRLTDLESLFTFTELKATFNDTTGQLTALFALSSANRDGVIDALLALSGWERRQLEALIDHLGRDGVYNQINGLQRLQAAFALAATLRTDIDFVIQLAVPEPQDFAVYRQQATALLETIRAQFDEETWPRVYKPIRDRLAVQQRDALLSLAMLQVGNDFAGRRDPDLLYEFLLLDVQIGSEVETSRLVQGIAALQLYVQRCLMNLEKGVDPATIPADQWEWMKNYRVWEANRKVFLYPESYIEPELRDTKTPLFAALEQELMQTDIDQVAVEKAYTNYLNSFAEVATLKIVGSYWHTEPGNPDSDKTLYLIGRTDTQPRVYYYRAYVNEARWLPWQKIDLTINADIATPVYVFNRLFLFWVEFTESSQSVGDSGQDTVPIYRPTVRYSYLNFTGSWLQPQIYDLGVRTVAALPAVRDAFQQANLRYSELQSFLGGLNPVAVTRPQLEDFIARMRSYAADIRSLTATLRQVATNSGALATQIRQTADSLDGNAGQLEGMATGLENVLDALTTVISILSGLVTAQLVNALDIHADTANNALSTAYATLDTLVIGDLSLNATQRNQVEWQQVYAQRAVEFAPPVPPEVIEGNARVLEVTADTDIQATIPDFAMDALTWSYWLNLLNNNPNGTVNEVVTTVTLVDYAAGRFQMTVTNNLTPIPGIAAAIQDLETRYRQIAAIADNLQPNQRQQLLTLVNEAITRTTALADQAQANTPAEDVTRIRTIAAELQGHATQLQALINNQPNSFSTQALSLTTVELGIAALTNVVRWQSPDLTLTVRLDQSTVTTLTLPYDQWRHLAVTLRYETDGYTVQLHVNGTPTGSAQRVTGVLLPAEGALTLAGQIVTTPAIIGLSAAYRTQLSEFRLWNRVRTATEIDAEKDERKAGRQFGLFHLPLNRQVANATMQLVRSALNFRFRPPVSPIRERERLVIFYGDGEIVRTRRNNQDDQSFTVMLANRFPTITHYDLTLSPIFDLYIGRNAGLITNDIMAGDTPTDQTFLVRQLPRNEATVRDVHNQPGWYLVDAGDEQFLVQAEVRGLLTAAELLQIEYSSDSQALTVFYNPADALRSGSRLPRFRFERLSTFAIYELSANLFRGGLDALLSLGSQAAAEVNFDAYSYNESLVIPPRRYNGLTDTIDFDGAYGLYYREIFFHVPFFIANRLNANQNFAEAQRWYHYIFNPTTQEAATGTPANARDRYWRYLPFRGLGVESLADLFDNREALAEYANDPFDPHAIARLRINAYQKAIVMKYIDNLLDWGDALFRQETRESINAAAQLYVLAFNLLGPRPEVRASQQFAEIGDYAAIRDAYNASDEIPEFITELSLTLGISGPNDNGPVVATPNNGIFTTFCVPENSDFIGFWDRVADRLFKIRHSLNIDGVFRQLALFAPPINPRALVQAIAGGRDIGSVLADLNVAVPHYRYSFVLALAKEMVSAVTDLGGALLSALESRDAEQLALLQNTHERNILALMTTNLERERDAARESIAQLRISKQNRENREQHYRALLDNGLSSEEIGELVLISLAQASKSTAVVAKGISAASFAVPDIIVGGAGIASPVTLTLTGGKAAGEVSAAVAEIAEFLGDIFSTAGTLTAKIGEYKRRENGWRLEHQTALFDVQEVDKQIEIAEFQLAIAEQALTIHQRTIAQNREIEEFYRRKFTNQDLYNWLISRLSGLYFQGYKLAYDTAKAAEKALQYELPTNERYISFGHFDSLRRGLLAGESLLLDLNRMDKSHLDQDSRFLEIEKIISLKRTFPAALRTLIREGACDFELSERLFDQDYPGHYFRVIKTIAITVRAQLDPLESLNASLTQLGNKTLIDPSIDAVRYLLGIEGAAQPDGSVVRVNWRANQQIAISRPTQDNGMFGSFDLNFLFDNRYFPFEGTGAVSTWRLEMPQARAFNFDRDDVVIHLKYTAKYDQGEFRTQVRQEVAALTG